jgi:hypothetical protein
MCPGWSVKTHGTPPIFVKGPSIFWLDTSHIRFFLLPSVRFDGGHARGICPCGVQVRIWLKPLIVLNTVLYLKLCWNKVCQNHFAHYYGNFIKIKVVNCYRDAGFSFREVWDKEVS